MENSRYADIKTPNLENRSNALSVAINQILKYTDKDNVTIEEVMGYTGQAFRINISNENVDVSGPSIFYYSDICQRGVQQLGFRAKCIGDIRQKQTTELLLQAINLIRASVDQGIPAVTWGLSCPDFGLIYGYNDSKQEMYGSDLLGDIIVPYLQLGSEELFVMTMGESFEIDHTEALKDSIDMILDHAYHNEHPAVGPYYNGLAGYDAWITAFEGGKVDAFGNSYNSAYIYDARIFAVKFLEGLGNRFKEDANKEKDIIRLSMEAADCYYIVSECLGIMHQMFPFPSGGNPNDPSQAKKAIELLKKSKDAEEQGLNLLSEIKMSVASLV